jgi:hypothetical protein
MSAPWVEEFSAAVERFLGEEAPDTLIEYRVSERDRARLYSAIGDLAPWRAGLRQHEGALAVAAVQAAADAEAGDEAYVRHFLGRIGHGEYRALWDNDYGPAIESFFTRCFKHRTSSGPWRYVRVVFRHAGIPVVAMRPYAQMLDRLLKGGPQFTFTEYLHEVRRVGSTFIKPFLQTQAGFKFTRTTGEYLRRHKRGELSIEELGILQGYRIGFWSELLAHVRGEIGTANSKEAPEPVLALDSERCQLIVRFDAQWQGRGAYRVNECPVTYCERRVGGSRPPTIQTGHSRPKPVDPWWWPGASPVAVFRSGDGLFLGATAPGKEQTSPLRGGSYFVAVDASLEPVLQKLNGTPFGPLDVLPQDDHAPSYDIWQVDLQPGTSYGELGLQTCGRLQMPALGFARNEYRPHPLGSNVFTGALPTIEVRHWTEAHDSEYALRLKTERTEREIAVPTRGRISVPLSAPAQGRLWIEPRGFSSATATLPSLEFTLMPPGVGVSVTELALAEQDQAQVVATVPEGWSIRPLTSESRPVDTNIWIVPARARTFDAVLVAPAFELPVSVRLPVVSFKSRGGDDFVWLESLENGANCDCELEARPCSGCSLWLCGQDKELSISGSLWVSERGVTRTDLRSHVDTLATTDVAVGIFVVRTGERTFETPLGFAAARRLPALITAFGEPETLKETCDVSPLNRLGEIGRGFFQLVTVLREPVRALSVRALVDAIGQYKLPDSIGAQVLSSIADLVHFAQFFDGATHDLPPEISSSPPAVALVSWLKASGDVAVPSIPRVRVERWRRVIDERLREEDDGHNAEALIAEWRQAIISGTHSALHERPGGRALSDAARRYREALGVPVQKLRNQGLTTVIGSLLHAQREAEIGSIVAGMACILEQLARYRSDRAVDGTKLENLRVPMALLPAVSALRRLSGVVITDETSGLSLGDVSPWDGDRKLQ